MLRDGRWGSPQEALTRWRDPDAISGSVLRDECP
eukprot:gene6671-5058_t